MEFKKYSGLIETVVEAEAPEVLDDINSGPGWQFHIAKLHQRGFSVIDAIKYTKLMSQNLNEDMAINEMKAISSKYKENHERR